MSRLKILRRLLKENGFEAVMITNRHNIEWLSSFTGSSGRLFVSQTEAFIATDSRYFEQAGQQAFDFTLYPIERKTLSWLPNLLSLLKISELAFEDDILFSAYQELSEVIKGLPKLKLRPLGSVLMQARSIKDDSEIANIRKAVAVTDHAFDTIASLIKPGISEKEAAWQTEKLMRDITQGQPLSFNIIVAAGLNSALPHAVPSDRPVKEAEPLLFDMGASYNGYCADLSRTIFLGKRPPFFAKIYDTVVKAQEAVIKGAKIGMSGAQVDELARSVIRKAGYDENFGHGSGHGLGLYIHEYPSLAPLSTNLLQENMVFTVEPGIYIPGQGGVRIEDTVLMTASGIEVLSSAIKSL
ncbi:MAG: Xaa-Pro peptidase family protein [Chloroflexi bacterium]|nr:Xaa-Pro peptidase family protein [Chloroflexota bacterium]